MSRSSTVWLFIAAMVSAAPALADPATAETYFREGRELLKAGKTAEACQAFAESQRLDPSSGALINLAACRMQEGKLASAWAEFVSAARQAAKEGKTERADEAAARALELEPRLPRFHVKLPPGAVGATLRRGGQDLGAVAFDRDLPVDPGQHLIEVLAPGFKTWSTTIDATEGKTVELVPPALEPLPAQPVPIAQPAPPPPAVVVAPKPEAPRSGSEQLIAGWATFGVGALAGSVGAITGGLALAANTESEELCPTRADCKQDALDAYDRADQLAWASNVLIPLGVAAAGAGIIVVMTAPAASEKQSSAWSLRAQVRPGGAGLEVAF